MENSDRNIEVFMIDQQKAGGMYTCDKQHVYHSLKCLTSHYYMYIWSIYCVIATINYMQESIYRIIGNTITTWEILIHHLLLCVTTWPQIVKLCHVSLPSDMHCDAVKESLQTEKELSWWNTQNYYDVAQQMDLFLFMCVTTNVYPFTLTISSCK